METITKRRKLKTRNAPYWQKVSVGKFIGFYRTNDGGSWRARILLEGQRYFNSIGGDINSNYEDMLKEASNWFEQVIKEQDPTKTKHTVNTIIDEYLEHLKAEKSNDASYRTQKQLEKHVLPTLGKIKLNNLTTFKLNKWRNSLVKDNEDPEVIRKSKDSINRVLSMLKAALNRAFKVGYIQSDVEWRRVTPFKNVSSSRDLFLTDKQISDLIKGCTGDIKELIQAGIYTGARAGELTNVKIKSFDPDNGIIKLNGKTGKRDVYLSEQGNQFFKEIIKGKDANIFVNNKEPWGKMAYSREVKNAIKSANLPSETVFYSLRHYHISKALKAGIPAQVIAENCGTSIRMIEKHYGKFMKADRHSMMNKVELGL